jgi:tRNA U34 5-carboxymethylaminomethyl modifying GTPase MnmE/TrmE
MILEYYQIVSQLLSSDSTVVTNLRHQQELVNTEHYLQRVITGIDKDISNDLLAMDIRQASSNSYN